MNKKTKLVATIVSIIFVIIVLLSIFGTLYAVYSNPEFFSDRAQVEQSLLSFGPWGPSAIIGGHIIQVVFPFIAGQVLEVVAGFLYGFWQGTIYNLVGIQIGSLIAFLLSKRYGRPLVEKLVNTEDLEKFDRFFEKHGIIILFLTRTQFYFPHDTISYGCGLIKNMTWKRFFLVSLVGFIPNVIMLTLYGTTFQESLYSINLIYYGAILFLIPALFLVRKPIYKILEINDDVLVDSINNFFIRLENRIERFNPRNKEK